MQKIWAIILLSALASNHEALPQTKWSRPIRNLQGQLTRERRQFPFGEWIPLTQSCPTCRLFADPLDAGLRGENIGLTPPRPPTVTRQIHGESNFFPQDESSILSVPPPPPSIATSSGSFQFSGFGQQFNSPSIPVPTQKIVPQTQQIQFFPQSFLPNQPLLVNGNQQILSGLNAQSNLFGQSQSQQQLNGNGKVTSFQNSEFKTHKLPENVVLEQNKRPVPTKPFPNKPQPFTQPQQNQQQALAQQQAFGGQRQHPVDFSSTILTPPPAPSNVSQDVVIPGLDKEEIQLLYVPVETLRQRGNPQEQLLTQQPQNIQFQNIQFSRPNAQQRPVNNIRPTEQTLVTQSPKGHFLTENGNSGGQSDSALKVTSVQPFSTSVTPSSLLLQHLPFQDTPQPFVSATPATPTIQPFVTPASVFQKFSPFTPETTLSQLSTIPNNIQFSQSDVDFGTTPKTLTSQGVFAEGIINRNPAGIGNLEQERPLQRPVQQPIVTQQQVLTRQPQQNSGVFGRERQKELNANGQFPNQIDQTQIALQKQQENQRLLQQQRQKELEEQRFLEEQRKQKELEEQRLIQQQRQKELEEQRILQKQKELEEQRLLQQQRQKELEQQQFIQKQKELEQQRLLQQQQRQKELEQQRYLQKQKELEQQRILQQQQRQKELEQQRFVQQQRQKELEEQRLLQEQRQKELEHQRRLQLQKQKELEEKRLLQQLKKQEEEQQRLLRFQQQQKELEQQKLLQENQQRLLQQQKLLQKQKQENLQNQQQFQLFQQQQKQNVPQQHFQQPNRHVLPDNDNLNLIPQLEKESENQQLVPHQPPLSVFFKGYNGAEARITDVLRELRSSNTITVLDQYFEKMPKVFVGPAGLIPPAGYGKFDLPYLSNLESNRIDRRIDKLPFFVAPLNFVPPPGYAKIPFPAPHVGSVVVSSESNPAMKLKSFEAGSSQTPVEEDNVSGSYPVVGPELPGLINNLDPITTTVQPTTTIVSTPSLPQTTAQLRNRRPNSSLYKPQNRKPIARTRSSTTSKPEEEVTQPIQKPEVSKDSEGIRKPFNRFLHRRRQQTKTTTESSPKGQQEAKNLENRFYSVEVYHQDKNQVPRTQVKSDVVRENPTGEQQHRQFEHSIDRITPGGHGVFEVRPTAATQQPMESEERSQDTSDYLDLNLQTFEDGPLPTGSAKTITQELYPPNAIAPPEPDDKPLSKVDSIQTSDKSHTAIYEEAATMKLADTSDVSPTATAQKETVSLSDEQVALRPTSVVEAEKQDTASEGYFPTEASPGEASFTPRPVTAVGDYQTKGFLDSNEQYTSAFAEISKHHHIPAYSDSSRRHPSTISDAYPTSEISVDLQAPSSRDYAEVRPTENAPGPSNSKFLPTGSTYESYSTGFEGISEHQQEVSNSQLPQVSPTAPAATDGRYTADFPVNSDANVDDERTASFISLQGFSGTANSAEASQQYFPRSTQSTAKEANPVVIVQNSVSSTTPEPAAEVTVGPSVQTYASVGDKFLQQNDQTQVTEDHSQDFADNLPTDHRLKLPNPSIVRVRTRTRGKSRGQVNFAASQSTTSAPFTRSDSKVPEHADQDHTTKANHFRDYHPVKTSKYNQFRGVKKPLRPTTTEPTTEYEQKANVYTIRPQRRPLNPSTVSTKRIRRPTTPIPSAETPTEVYGIPTAAPHSDHSYISPSGVSNDVYYEQSSLSPVKSKFRKHFGSAAEQKNDFVPVYSSTPFPTTFSSTAYNGYSEESSVVGELVHPVAPQQDINSDKYPDWNPSESGFDVSGIVLTTIRTSSEEDQSEVEEPKKAQDSKKAFDPDLEKKTGRRRVRVRVHKRPHENFETAESQNLRTVANVLVPPTSTYKPNDESGFHQLAKNADFSFGGQKLFGLRSREYFRKRLNLTESEGVSKGEQPAAENGTDTETKSSGLVRKSQTNDVESASAPSNESTEGSKTARPKFRGFVRKVVKHGGVRKDKESDSNQLAENEESEGKHGSGEFHPRQTFRVHQSNFNHTGRVNGTKHKTFVRFVKKNKVRQHETEPQVESNFQEHQKESESVSQSDLESQHTTQTPETSQPTSTAESQSIKDQQEQTEKVTQTEQEETETQRPETELQQPSTTEEPEVKGTQQPSLQATKVTESQTSESSSQSEQEFTSQASPTTPLTQQSRLYLTQRPKFFQTLKPIFPRTSQATLYRAREAEAPSSTTEQAEPQERRTFSRYKYGKTAAASTEKPEDSKKLTEQQIKGKNLHTLEVRKYLRTKSREGAFSQFSRNRYAASEKTESASITDQTTSEKEPEEFTTQTESTIAEPKTTELFLRTDTTEVELETTKIEDDTQGTTTEVITTSSEEKGSEEEETSDEEDAVTEFVNAQTTAETEAPTTALRSSNADTPEKVTTETPETPETQTAETQPDIYRFSKDSFSFDETENFTGTKNRAYVRNITTDIIENTASFSAPGVERRPDIRVVKQRLDQVLSEATEESGKEKTEPSTTEPNAPETTTGFPEAETTAAADAITKSKVAKILKTSTTTKISHETEICYRGKCIRTKSDNPDEDLKLLVDSASTMKIEKTKT